MIAQIYLFRFGRGVRASATLRQGGEGSISVSIQIMTIARRLKSFLPPTEVIYLIHSVRQQHPTAKTVF